MKTIVFGDGSATRRAGGNRPREDDDEMREVTGDYAEVLSGEDGMEVATSKSAELSINDDHEMKGAREADVGGLLSDKDDEDIAIAMNIDLQLSNGENEDLRRPAQDSMQYRIENGGSGRDNAREAWEDFMDDHLEALKLAYGLWYAVEISEPSSQTIEYDTATWVARVVHEFGSPGSSSSSSSSDDDDTPTIAGTLASLGAEEQRKVFWKLVSVDREEREAVKQQGMDANKKKKNAGGGKGKAKQPKISREPKRPKISKEPKKPKIRKAPKAPKTPKDPFFRIRAPDAHTQALQMALNEYREPDPVRILRARPETTYEGGSDGLSDEERDSDVAGRIHSREWSRRLSETDLVVDEFGAKCIGEGTGDEESEERDEEEDERSEESDVEDSDESSGSHSGRAHKSNFEPREQMPADVDRELGTGRSGSSLANAGLFDDSPELAESLEESAIEIGDAHLDTEVAGMTMESPPAVSGNHGQVTGTSWENPILLSDTSPSQTSRKSSKKKKTARDGKTGEKSKSKNSDEQEHTPGIQDYMRMPGYAMRDLDRDGEWEF